MGLFITKLTSYNLHLAGLSHMRPVWRMVRRGGLGFRLYSEQGLGFRVARSHKPFESFHTQMPNNA